MVANDDETCRFASTSSKAILSALQPGAYTVLVDGAAIGTGDTSGTFGIELGCHPIGTAPTPQPTLVPTQRQSGTPTSRHRGRERGVRRRNNKKPPGHQEPGVRGCDREVKKVRCSGVFVFAKNVIQFQLKRPQAAPPLGSTETHPHRLT